MLCVYVFRKVFLFINVASFSVRHIGQNEKLQKIKQKMTWLKYETPKLKRKKMSNNKRIGFGHFDVQM